MSKNMPRVLAENVERHIRTLTEEIGARLAGSLGERQAADYIAEQMRSIGAKVHVEDFDVCERAVKQEHLEMHIGGEWQTFACSLLGNAIGTDGQTVEAPVVFFTAETDYQRKDLSFLSGKAVVHLGSHIETADYYRRLVEAEPAFVMFVDVRYPGNVATADGMFPAYTHAYGRLDAGHNWGWAKLSFCCHNSGRINCLRKKSVEPLVIPVHLLPICNI